MSEFIVGIIVDILGDVGIENREGRSKGRVTASALNFAIWDTAQFVVLNPEVRF